MLLGLAREGQGVAAQVLVMLGAGLPQVRERVLVLLGDVVEPTPPGVPGPVTVPARAQPPRCLAGLAETAAYRVVEATGEEDEPARFVVVYCRRCGTALGTAT